MVKVWNRSASKAPYSARMARATNRRHPTAPDGPGAGSPGRTPRSGRAQAQCHLLQGGIGAPQAGGDRQVDQRVEGQRHDQPAPHRPCTWGNTDAHPSRARTGGRRSAGRRARRRPGGRAGRSVRSATPPRSRSPRSRWSRSPSDERCSTAGRGEVAEQDRVELGPSVLGGLDDEVARGATRRRPPPGWRR